MCQTRVVDKIKTRILGAVASPPQKIVSFMR